MPPASACFRLPPNNGWQREVSRGYSLIEDRLTLVFNPDMAEKCVAGLADSDAEICVDAACPKHSMQHQTFSQTRVPHAQPAIDQSNSLRSCCADQTRFRRRDPQAGPPFVVQQQRSKRTSPDLELGDCRQYRSFDSHCGQLEQPHRSAPPQIPLSSRADTGDGARARTSNGRASGC